MSPHPFVHIELSAKDPAASSKFYAELCGWKVEVDPKFDYYQFRIDNGFGGAFVKPDGQMYEAGDVVPYIGTDNIDAMLNRIESLGGKVVQPKTRIEGIGWYAFFADPSGTRMGLFESISPR